MKNEQETLKSSTALLRTAALLAILTAGLCACVCANTSAAKKAIVQNELAIAPHTKTGDLSRQTADRDA